MYLKLIVVFEKIKYNDKMKRKICKEHDVNVIDIKYTWMETEKEIRDILHKNGLDKHTLKVILGV